MNGNPAISFSASDDRLGLKYFNDMPTGDFWITSVYQELNMASTNEHLWTYGSNNSYLRLYPAGHFYTMYGGTYLDGSGSITTGDDGNPHIITLRRTGSTNSQVFDGKQVKSGTNSSAPTSEACLVLGEYMGTDCTTFHTSYDYTGELGEMIVYNSYPSATDQQKINSYLALKYGITLDQTTPTDYLASDGTTKMWNKDATGASTHNINIAGIGRDDATALNQTQSISSNTGEILTVSSPSDLDDLEFMTWGTDNGSLVAGSDDLPITDENLPANAITRLGRVWQVQNANGDGVGTVSVDFNVTSQTILLRSGDASDYALLISATTDFSAGSAHVTGASVGSNHISFTTASIPDGSYITLAGPAAVGPAGLTDNLSIWLKADSGVTNTGNATDATAWTDRSVNETVLDHNTSPAIGGTYPTYYSSRINNNPGLSFDWTPTTWGPIHWLILQQLTYLSPGIPRFNVSRLANKLYTRHGTSNEILLEVDTGEMAVAISNTFGYSTDVSADDNIPHIMAGLRTGSNIDGEFDGLDMGITASDGVALPTGQCLVLGEDPDSDCGGFSDTQAFEGDLAELIIYSYYPTAADRQQIYSYLALKYGITLDQTTPTDYLASDGTTKMWNKDATGASTYNNDIAGIGKDTLAGLNQTQSRSTEIDSLLTVSSPSDLENLEFMTWGNNNALGLSAEIPSQRNACQCRGSFDS